MYINSTSNEIIIEIWKLLSVFANFSPYGVFCFLNPFGASFLSPSGAILPYCLSVSFVVVCQILFAKFVLKCFQNFFFSERSFLFQRSLP